MISKRKKKRLFSFSDIQIFRFFNEVWSFPFLWSRVDTPTISIKKISSPKMGRGYLEFIIGGMPKNKYQKKLGVILADNNEYFYYNPTSFLKVAFLDHYNGLNCLFLFQVSIVDIKAYKQCFRRTWELHWYIIITISNRFLDS